MVRLSCGVQCAGACLFALNVLFCVLGLTVMGFGIYVRVSGNFEAVSELYSISEAFGDETFEWVAIAMIVGGVLTALLAAFGCLGSILHKRAFLYIYAILLSFIIVVEFAAVVTTLVYRNDLWKTYDSGFMELFQHSYAQNRTDAIRIIQHIEKEFDCCGVDGSSDYIKNHLRIPQSCYANPNLPLSLHTEGCATAIANWLWNQLPIVAGVLGSVLFIELAGLIGSLVLGVALAHAEPYEKF